MMMEVIIHSSFVQVKPPLPTPTKILGGNGFSCCVNNDPNPGFQPGDAANLNGPEDTYTPFDPIAELVSGYENNQLAPSMDINSMLQSLSCFDALPMGVSPWANDNPYPSLNRPTPFQIWAKNF